LSEESVTPPERNATAQALDHLFRHEYGRLVAILLKQLGPARLHLAEDVVQDALLRAARVWPYHGVPPSPTAWLLTTARRRAIDLGRRDRRWRDLGETLAHDLAALAAHATDPSDTVFTDELRDATLRAMFLCCHPDLPPGSQLALMLKTLGGFGEGEIGAALLLRPNTVAQRLSRARRVLREADDSTGALPPVAELAHRTPQVLHALYLLFNEGYQSSQSDAVIRADLCAEARRLLGELVRVPWTSSPAAEALLALMYLHVARFDGRLAGDGTPLLLREQDRSRWNRQLIAQGMRHLQASGRGTELSRYHLEAGIAACHCLAPDYAATDWKHIAGLYAKLATVAPSPLVTLNYAISLIEAGDLAPARRLLAKHPGNDDAPTRVLWQTVQAHMAEKENRIDAARAAYQEALAANPTPAERRVLARRLALLS
jgi:RNA polymerase sigma-70 factor (ECF subfamily)